MARILLAYASTHGHTAKIAARIAEVMRGAHHHVVVYDDVASIDPDLNVFDAVVVGASIHSGHHQPDLVAWAERHSTSLGLHPSAFFSVCLTQRGQHPTDITRDFDYTDWDAVDAFACACAELTVQAEA